MHRLKKYFSENVNLSAGIIYTLLLSIVFFPLIVGTATLNWDALDLWLSWKHFIVEELFNGYLPLWNPYHVNGFPQHADSMTWYPISWFFGFLNGNYNLSALNQEYLFHLFIAAFGFFKFSSTFTNSIKVRFFLGLSYMFSGFMIGNAQHIAWIISAAWLPWLFYYLFWIFKEQKLKISIKLALVSFFFFSGGYLALFFVTLYFVLAYVFFKFFKLKKWKFIKKPLLYLCLTFLIITCLSLPILYSYNEVFYLLNRFNPNATNQNFDLNIGATPWNGILAIILPFASGIYNISEINFGSFSTFFGLTPVIILIIWFRKFFQNKKIFFLFCLAVFFLLCSMGDVFPLRKIISLLPFLDLFRYPTLFRLFFIFLVLIIVGVLSNKINFIVNRSKINFIIFSLFLFLLISLSIFFYFKSDLNSLTFYLKHLFDFNFLQEIKLETRIFVNLLILFFISILVLLIYIIKKKNTIKNIVFSFWFFELLFVAITSAPHTVYHKINVGFANKTIDYQAKNYPSLEKNHEHNETILWNDFIYFSWQGKTLFLKQFSKNWYNPLELIEKKSRFKKNEINNLPLYSIVKIQNNKISLHKNQTVRLKIQSNQCFKFTNLPKNKENIYFAFKHNYFPEWEISSMNKSIKPINFNSNFILIPLKKINSDLVFNYNVKNYHLVFWISISILSLLVVLLFYFSSTKKWNVLFLIFILIFFLVNSFDRISSKRNLTSKEFSSYPLFKFHKYKCKSSKSLENKILVKQNKAKPDIEIAFLEYFYSKKIKTVSYDNMIYEIRKKAEIKRKIIFSDYNNLVENGYQLNLKSIILKKYKVLCIKLNYSLLTNSESNQMLWISQFRSGKWIRGKAIDLSKSQHQIIQFFDISQFEILPTDELKLYFWDEKYNGKIKINSLELSELNY